MKRRAAALLLLTVACNGVGQKSAAPEIYRQTRAAIEHGDYVRARSLAAEGLRASAGRADYRELFAIADAEALSRTDAPAALALLDRTPQSGNPEARVRRLIARGYALQAHGQCREAIPVYAEADRLAAALMPPLRAEITMFRITPYFCLEEWEPAERVARQAIDLGKTYRNAYALANAYGMLATVEMNQEKWEKALEHFGAAARIARPIAAGSTLSVITGNIGWCSQQLGDLDDAQARFTEAERYAESQNVLRVQPIWLTNIANVFVARQQFTDALPYATRSVAAARKLGDPKNLATSLSNLAQIDIDLGDYTAAKRDNGEALALIRRNQGSELTALINEARIDDATGASDQALETLDSVIAARSDQASVRWQAQAIAAEINRRLGRTAAAAQMYEAALATGDSARPVMQTDAYLFTFESNLIRFYDRYIDLLLTDGRVVDALRVAERSRARALRDGLGLAADPHLDPVPLARANGAAILWYWLAPKRSLVWIVAADGVSVERLPAQEQIERTVDAYRRESVARYDGLASPRATALFETLVRPAIAHARTSRFIIIPDGRLNDINLEAAVVPSPQPHYWIDEATISYAPSMQFLASTEKRRALRDSRVLVVGNVPGQEGFPALARAGTEMQNVARHFDPQRQVLLAGLGATRDAVLQSDLQDASFIHFATHSTASVTTPLESSVILAGDRRLTGRDIAAMKLRAELVTVSSCNSAGRRSYAGEGLVGLAWAFLRAGAKRVVAAQWDVSDSATSMLMDRMYGELASGRDPASALRTAKLALLHSGKGYDRPFYWAPFILYGAP